MLARVGMALLLAAVAMSAAAGTPPAASAATATGLLPPRLEARYQRLTSDFRCPVCQNEPIATSQSQIAVALRDIVRRKLLAGETDAQIRRYMISRYGLFAVYDPPVRRSTFLLWFGPLILLLIGAGVAGRAVYQRRRLLRRSDSER